MGNTPAHPALLSAQEEAMMASLSSSSPDDDNYWPPVAQSNLYEQQALLFNRLNSHPTLRFDERNSNLERQFLHLASLQNRIAQQQQQAAAPAELPAGWRTRLLPIAQTSSSVPQSRAPATVELLPDGSLVLARPVQKQKQHSAKPDPPINIRRNHPGPLPSSAAQQETEGEIADLPADCSATKPPLQKRLPSPNDEQTSSSTNIVPASPPSSPNELATPTKNKTSTSSYDDEKQERWDIMFECLKEYRAINGDCLVPRIYKDNPALGNWVWKQRSNYRADKLDDDRFARLEAIGFVWNARRHAAQVAAAAGKKRRIRKKKINAIATAKPKETAEEKRNRSSCMMMISDERQHSSQPHREDQNGPTSVVQEPNVNSSSSSNTKQERWERMFELLKEYKEVFGDCRVPQGYKEVPGLGNFVDHQRRAFISNKLDEGRAAKLDSIGFTWVAGRPKKQSLREDLWREMFARLESYKQVHGDCLIPKRYSKDQALADWVWTQRAYNKYRILPADRKARLDSIRFGWIAEPTNDRRAGQQETALQHSTAAATSSASTEKSSRADARVVFRKARPLPTRKRKLNPESISQEERWNTMFKRLEAYKHAHGNCSVPRCYLTDSRLGRWVHTQRAAYRENRLHPDRVSMLDSIDFLGQIRARASISGERRTDTAGIIDNDVKTFDPIDRPRKVRVLMTSFTCPVDY